MLAFALFQGFVIKRCPLEERMVLFFRLLLIAGLGLLGAACIDDGSGPRTAYPGGGYYGNAPPRDYYYSPPPRGEYNSTDGRRYTTVRVTNVGQNGYANDVVDQKVVCGSTYYDGYRTQRAPSC
jgi:hypothetical protein